MYYSLPPTPIKPYIFINKNNAGYSIASLIKQSNELGDEPLSNTMSDLYKKLKSINNGTANFSVIKERGRLEELQELPLQITEVENKGISVRGKRLSRKYTDEYTGSRLSVTTVRNLYLAAHLTRADLSIMKDFEDFKDELSIVSKEYVTMGKGFEYDGCNVNIRDTGLLAPGNQKSLKAIGRLYGANFNKKELTQHEITNMDEVLLKDKKKFIEYSKMDAIIPLIHILSMELYNWKVNALGVPLTLSSIASRYVKKH
jgi:hypothetical protein